MTTRQSSSAPESAVRDGRALAAAGVVDELGAESDRHEPAGRVVGHDTGVADLDGGLDDVAEHRERDVARGSRPAAGSSRRPGRG